MDWEALLSTMQSDLANGDWITKSYHIGTRRREFRDIKEFLEMLKYVETKAAFESNAISGRTYARQVRRH